jgi:hypothetical protein
MRVSIFFLLLFSIPNDSLRYPLSLIGLHPLSLIGLHLLHRLVTSTLQSMDKTPGSTLPPP